jgi:CheY-like chemotaxis protein
MAPQNSLRVLVIDDEPSVVNRLVRILSRDGYTVETADNGVFCISPRRGIFQ